MNRLIIAMTTLTLLSAFARADIAEDGRRILAEHADAVVSVRLVVKSSVSMNGRSMENEESTTEATGTVIDASGLTVLSRSSTDPASVIASMMGEEMGEVDFKTTVEDVKILTRNGGEIAARIVLRDADLDLAYVKPVEPLEEPMPFVDLTAATEPEVLEELVVLGRLGRVAGRSAAASMGRVVAMVDTPRRFYVMETSELVGLGTPVFRANGTPVGILLLRTVEGEGGGGMMQEMFMGASAMGMLTIALPAADVLETAQQIEDGGNAASESPEEEK